MLFLQAVAIANTFTLETAYLISGLDDLVGLGIDADYDSANSVAVFQQINEFYQEAGDGALLWIVGVDTDTAYTAYVATDTFTDHIRRTIQDDPDQRAKMLGFCYAPPAALQSDTDFPADVLTGIPAIQTALDSLFDEGFQLSAVLDGYNMSSTVNPLNLGTMATKGAHLVSLCISSTLGNGISQVGAALGRAARISVGHGWGAVADGARKAQTAYLTNGLNIATGTNMVIGSVYTVAGGPVTYNGTLYAVGKTFMVIAGHLVFTTTAGGYVISNSSPIRKLKQAVINALGGKQFLFMRYWFGRSGYYWNDAATCDDPTDTLSSQEYNRVANNLSASALFFIIGKIGSNYPLNVATGDLSQTVLNSWQGDFKTKYIDPLASTGGTGDITDGSLLLAGPNFLATRNVNFQLKIVPTVIMGSADGTVEFDATL